MRIDLHTHSRVSDGTQSPTELVRAAAAAGLDVVAITDHDTAASWDEAAQAASEVGIDLVRGMEISTRHHGRGVHLLGYLPDPTHPGLVEALDLILGGRSSRVPGIVANLQALDIPITEALVAEVSGDSAASGRPHVADALIRLGVVADRTEAFERFLNPGRPGYVDRYAAELETMIDLVAAAGGVTVIAHPWGRSSRTGLDEGVLAALAERGLAGVEVDHQDHDAVSREQLRAIAGNLGLVATGSSDHHGLGKIDHDLGCNTTAPEQYDRLIALAGTAAQRSGRGAPGGVLAGR